MAITKRYRTTIYRDGATCFVPVGFDPKVVFGKVRAPVKVTIAGYTYRSTIASMGDGPCIPLRKSHREAAGLEGGETLMVTLELDEDARVVEVPEDLAEALRAARCVAAWEALGYSHKREHVEAIAGAKKAETRARRVAGAITALRGRG